MFDLFFEAEMLRFLCVCVCVCKLDEDRMDGKKLGADWIKFVFPEAWMDDYEILLSCS